MTLSGSHTAYYIVLLISMAFIIVLHMIALASDKWVEGIFPGLKINEGLRICCHKRFTEEKCIKCTDEIPGNQIRFFLTTVLQSLR